MGWFFFQCCHAHLLFITKQTERSFFATDKYIKSLHIKKQSRKMFWNVINMENIRSGMEPKRENAR